MHFKNLLLGLVCLGVSASSFATSPTAPATLYQPKACWFYNTASPVTHWQYWMLNDGRSYYLPNNAIVTGIIYSGYCPQGQLEALAR